PTQRNHTAIDNLMKIVEEAGIKDRVEYIAFSFDNCKYILSKDPDAMVGYLMGDRAPASVLDAGIRSVDYSSGAYTNNPGWIKEARNLGMIVNVWTINSAIDILKFIGQGVDYITTDAPALATELADKKFIEE
ncbi:MAG: glycerophosphodiester phosphodiesterase, partial [Muribaculaceae bacterium]|nr:glycerophosphodiester phosphodiesterase [Muribaculaceae bacterium]